jgi:RNA polymerase subunit RPABC4/transcription elongation factor Spt4
MSNARCYHCNRVKDADEMTVVDVEDYDGGHRTELICEACEKNPHWYHRPKCERCHKFVSTNDANVRFHQQHSWDGGVDWDGYVHIVCPQNKRRIDKPDSLTPSGQVAGMRYE